MKKKLMSMLLVFGLMFALCACEEKEDYTDDVDSNDYNTEEKNADYENVQELISRGTWNTEDSKGYKVQGEIKTTGLIRASDWGTVESTFNSLDPPESLPGFDAVAPDGANQDTSAVLIGAIELKNITDGWDFSESSPYDCALYFDAPDLYGNNFSSLCVMYGSGLKKYSFGGVRGYLDTYAVMKSNNWFVSFVIIIPEAFTPNEPEGSENVLNTVLRISGNGGGCEFTVPGLSE